MKLALGVPWLPLVVSDLLRGPVTFDERSLLIGGSRELILSGSVHYPRVHPSEWDRVFTLAKELGLNSIQTYVFWSSHEVHLSDHGTPTWSGSRNVSDFIQRAGAHGLYVSLRIGPYVCGEYTLGGIPIWLRTLDGIRCFRCNDPVWRREMQRWVTAVVSEVAPLFQPHGNIIALQIENEYGEKDQTYLDWAVDMARDLTKGTLLPWFLCHTYPTCFATNNRNGTYDFRVLCAMNGFWMEEYTVDPDQPSPKWIQDLRTHNPGQPAMWTEDQGWFDEWLVAKRVRQSGDQLYGIARFLAYGGSYHNFYMLTGGNNYGLQAGGMTATAYAPDTVISNFLLRHQPRFEYYKKFFGVVLQYKNTLLSHAISKTRQLPSNASGGTSTAYATLLPCTDTDPAHAGTLDASQRWDFDSGLLRTNFTGVALCIAVLQNSSVFPSKTVELSNCDPTSPDQQWNFENGRVFSHASFACKTGRCHHCLQHDPASTSLSIQDCIEGQDGQRWLLDRQEQGIRSSPGICLSGSTSGGGTVELHEYGGLAFLSNTGPSFSKVTYLGRDFVLAPASVVLVDTNSKEKVADTADATDPEQQRTTIIAEKRSSSWWAFQEQAGFGAETVDANYLREQLNLTEGDSDYLWYKAAVPTSTNVADVKVTTLGGAIAYPYLDGRGHLAILSVAMGLPVHPEKGGTEKGIAEVRIDNKLFTPMTWSHSWVLEGELHRVFDPQARGNVSWRPFGAEFARTPWTWLKTTMDLPTKPGPELSFALDLSGMWKGVAYVNGFHIGRYWLAPGLCTGDCAPPVKNGHCYMHWKDCGEPTQNLYHVPSGVLQPKGNLIVLFEETQPQNLPRKLSAVRLVALAASTEGVSHGVESRVFV